MKNQMMGEYNHTMDTKGRLIVPAKFREAGGDRFVVTKGLEKCLFLFTEEKWDSVVESISHMPLTHKNARAFSRFSTTLPYLTCITLLPVRTSR